MTGVQTCALPIYNFTYNQYGAPLGLTHNANVNVYNSIIWGNVPYQAFTNSFEDDPDSLYIYHSCVENGLGGINIMGDRKSVV